MTKRRFTEAEIDLARAMRRDGASWNAVARALGRHTPHGIHRALDADYREQYNERKRDYMREYMRHRHVVSLDVHDRRPILLAPANHADLTAALMGDPPIGRSALDARREVPR